MGQESGFISRSDDGYHESVTDQLIAHVDRNGIRRRMNDFEDNVEQSPQSSSDEWNSRNVGKGHNGPSIVQTSMLWQATTLQSYQRELALQINHPET
jgi:hypothetical protein